MTHNARATVTGSNLAKLGTSLAALACTTLTNCLAASADEPNTRPEIMPFSDTYERELSIQTLVVFDDYMKSTDDDEQMAKFDALVDTCTSTGLGTACFLIGYIFEGFEPDTARALYTSGCYAAYPNLEACRRAEGLALERDDAGAREQDMLSDVFVAGSGVLGGNFSQKADGLDAVLKLCGEGSGFACTFLADFSDTPYNERAVMGYLKAGCDTTYPDAYACHRRATLYANGAVGEQDPALALQYAEKGCVLGWPDACDLRDSLTN